MGGKKEADGGEKKRQMVWNKRGGGLKTQGVKEKKKPTVSEVNTAEGN